MKSWMRLLGMCIGVLAITLHSAVAEPSAMPAPTYAPRPDEGQGDLPTLPAGPVLPVVVIRECPQGSVRSCASGICLPASFSPARVERACRDYESAAREFTFRCELPGESPSSKAKFFGMTRKEEDCREITKAWNQFSSDPRVRAVKYSRSEAEENHRLPIERKAEA